jgi:hypothetical protein
LANRKIHIEEKLMKAYFAITLLLAGCGGSGAINITKTVGAQGGTVSHSDGSGVTIPAGALTANSMITLATVNATAPTGTVLVGPAYDFGPDGTTFNQPVTITLPFTAKKIPAGRTSADIIIYTAPLNSTEYVALSTTVAGATVQTTATHFTVYLPAVKLPTDGGSTDNCTSSCSVSSTSPGCGCSAECNGHSYSIGCSAELTTGPAQCFCEVDGQTQSTGPITLDSCTMTQVQQAFSVNCLPN